jgi:hypothetical protein
MAIIWVKIENTRSTRLVNSSLGRAERNQKFSDFQAMKI